MTCRSDYVAPLIDSEYEEQLFEESDGHPYITKNLLGEVANAVGVSA